MFGSRRYFGFLKTHKINPEPRACEIEVGEHWFADDKEYTEQEVDNILHPLIWIEPVFENTEKE